MVSRLDFSGVTGQNKPIIIRSGKYVLAALAVAGTGLGILQRDGVIVAVSAIFVVLALAAAAGVIFGAALIMESLG